MQTYLTKEMFDTQMNEVESKMNTLQLGGEQTLETTSEDSGNNSDRYEN